MNRVEVMTYLVKDMFKNKLEHAAWSYQIGLARGFA